MKNPLALALLGLPCGWMAWGAAPADVREIPPAPVAELTRANGWPDPGSYRTWTRSNGGPTSNRYSALTQINRANVDRLEVAWIYRSGDGRENLQSNPIVVDDLIFLPTAGSHIVALQAGTGEEVWRYRPEKSGNGLEDLPARRGLLYWPGDDAHPPRILFTAGNWIYALDPTSGRPIESFGTGGRTPLPAGGTATGAVYRHVLVIPGFHADVFGFDVRTGRQLWIFKTVPTGDAFGADTWSTPQWGANSWGGMSLDESRGLAYVATGSPKPNFFGMDRLGDNLFGNCVIALDALTGERRWHFQEIAHDIWDWDLPAPPNLVTVEREGVRVDAVAQVTKIGNTLLLDRETGRPLFPYRLRRAPELRLPGDRGAEFQPDLELPEPFARQAFTRADITRRTPAAEAAVRQQVERANLGRFPTMEEDVPTVLFNIHGGAEWTGAAVDPSGRLYVTSNEVPWLVTVSRQRRAATRPATATPVEVLTTGQQLYRQFCAACHGDDREGRAHAPALRALDQRMPEAEILQVLAQGRGSMPPMTILPEEQRSAVTAYLLQAPAPDADPAATNSSQWTFSAFGRLLDPDGFPGGTPPWGTLTCLDLNTGRIVWRRPLGEYPELTAEGLPPTGTENFGGATVTAGGVVFASGTRDRKIRAFDAETGEELWSHELPLHGTAPATVYESGGRQFVILPATGGGKLGGETGDAWIAFALPQ